MKVKIKGLSFVGFAAAILSANAMAATTSDNTVTSKAYVDAKISSSGSISSTSTTTAPNEQAVYNALGAVQTQNTVTGTGYVTATVDSAGTTVSLADSTITSSSTLASDGTRLTREQDVKGYADAKVSGAATVSSSATTTAPNEKAVYDAVATKLNHNLDSANAGKILVIDNSGEVVPSSATGANTYQAKSTDSKLAVADGNGGWTTLGSKITNGTYVAATADSSTGNVTIDVTATTAKAGIASALDTSTKLVTDYAVKDYAQTLDTGTVYKVTKAGSWDAISNAVVDGTYTTQTVDSTSGAVTIDVDATLNTALSEGAKIPTAGTVKTYVDNAITGANHGVVLPTIDSNTCNSSTPCALVLSGDQPAWVPMAQATTE